jgi:hypothetical protein
MTTRWIIVGLLLVLVASPGLAYQGDRSLLYETFESAVPPTLPVGWTVLNPNGDAGTWGVRRYGGVPWGVQCIRYRSDVVNPADDWIFTPAVNLASTAPCSVRYMVRGSATVPPLTLGVYAGTAPTPASMVLMVQPGHVVDGESYAQETGVFVPPTAGAYYIGWRVAGPPGTGRLDVDDVDVSVPETGLRLSLGMTRELDLVPLAFSPNDTMEACAFIENVGTASSVLNTRFSVGRWPSATELDFYVTGPTGRLPIINLFAKMGNLRTSHFTTLAPGQIAGKTLNLWGWYQFDTPGVYTIEVHYRNYSDPGGLGAWKGELVADPITLTIE